MESRRYNRSGRNSLTCFKNGDNNNSDNNGKELCGAFTQITSPANNLAELNFDWCRQRKQNDILYLDGIVHHRPVPPTASSSPCPAPAPITHLCALTCPSASEDHTRSLGNYISAIIPGWHFCTVNHAHFCHHAQVKVCVNERRRVSRRRRERERGREKEREGGGGGANLKKDQITCESLVVPCDVCVRTLTSDVCIWMRYCYLRHSVFPSSIISRGSAQ